MNGHVAMVTGGGTGLGRRFAAVLAQAGATVILCGRRVDKLEETAAAIRERNGEAHCIAMDVADADSVTGAFAQALEIGPVSVLLNNAGVASEPMLLDLPEETWDTVMDINLKGAWLVARAAARQMIDAGSGGSIVNISSILGSSVQKGTGAYAAAKAGLLHLNRAMALEWARYSIRVNAIAPGYYHTDIAGDYLDSDSGRQMLRRIPQRRLGSPEELDGVLLLLASNALSYMTGSVVTVDGGLSLSII
ncbi:SDR family oxidoreductase [Seongchinamella sediminis]|uniref:SDR family oxidoreductase n=2 Tax=Seongchinamella sediminis TaxID=2283635 RepID=A0A3L7E0Q7_9GAMM|nr:SDR family oxidoreductase [Seongchinamella sediminis]